MTETLTGRPASPGVALAPAFVIAPRPARTELPPQGTPEEEEARAADALARAAADLEALAEKVEAEAGPEEAAIFEAHAAFAADPELADQVAAATREGVRAEEAVRTAFDGFREVLAASPVEYMAARAADLDDVRDQVIDLLIGADEAPVPSERSVIVALELTPSQTTRLPRDLIAAIACESGSPTSHAAILARSLGIPAVVGVTGLLEAATPGTPLAVDGDAGTVAVDPDAELRADFAQRAERHAEREERLAELRDEPGRTADGRHVELAANVNDPGAIDAAREFGAEGSGLVRTEFLFLESETAPTIDEQVAYYRRVLAAFPGQRVVVRTMDIGADKPLPFVQREPEENPALGVRGLRLGLVMPELLRDQLRALLRAAAAEGSGSGRLAVMFPLVSRVDELQQALEVFEEVAAEEGADRAGIEVGVMVEVPSAALAARRFARHVDFLSIGTNDLLQYLFAADRLLADVAGLPELFDPDVLRLIREVFTSAHEEQAWVGVCGEAAADPLSAAVLVGLGVDELSMTPRAVPAVKDLLRRLDSRELARAAAEAVAADSVEAAREAVNAVVAAASDA